MVSWHHTHHVLHAEIGTALDQRQGDVLVLGTGPGMTEAHHHRGTDLQVGTCSEALTATEGVTYLILVARVGTLIKESVHSLQNSCPNSSDELSMERFLRGHQIARAEVA